jgi:hypothetical protein
MVASQSAMDPCERITWKSTTRTAMKDLHRREERTCDSGWPCNREKFIREKRLASAHCLHLPVPRFLQCSQRVVRLACGFRSTQAAIPQR